MRLFSDANIDSFANPIRRFVAGLIGCSLKELEYIKDQPSSRFNGLTPRYAMQTLGTEWGRHTLYDNLWIDALFHRNRYSPVLILPDVRFDNEALAVKERGGYIIRVVRDDYAHINGSHASEQGISAGLVDGTIHNSGSVAEFIDTGIKTVKDILSHHAERHSVPLQQKVGNTQLPIVFP